MEKLTQRPKTIFGASLFLYMIYFALLYGAKIEIVALGFGAGVFLIWSIVAGIRAAIRTKKIRGNEKTK